MAGLPNESAAYLFGNISKREGKIMIHVEIIIPARLQQATPSSFEIDPKDQYLKLKEMEKASLELVGIAHSHPGRQFVSATDRHFMKNPGPFTKICWVIVGEYNNAIEIGAYYIVDGEIHQIPIHLHGKNGA